MKSLHSTHLLLTLPTTILSTFLILTPQQFLLLKLTINEDFVLAERTFLQSFQPCRVDFLALPHPLIQVPKLGREYTTELGIRKGQRTARLVHTGDDGIVFAEFCGGKGSDTFRAEKVGVGALDHLMLFVEITS